MRLAMPTQQSGKSNESRQSGNAQKTGRSGKSWTKIAALAVSLMLLALAATAGPAAAHNPACHQVAGEDGPHYDDDRTGSDTAYDKNRNLGGDEYPENENSADGCSTGNSQSPHYDGAPHDEE